VLGIVGEPGLGKSRLLAEFTHSLRGRLVTYGEGHCLPYSSATPYLPVRDLLRQLWDLSDSVPALAITATVSQRLHEAGVASEAETLLLLQLLDVPVDLAPLAALDPPTRKARTFALLWHLIRHTSQRQPLVLAVENLHWSDPTSDEWLASLVERLGDTPVLLVVTYRPGYQPPWLGRAVATQIALPRLSLADSLAVLQSVPQAAQLAAPVQQAIVAKAAGNPFFVEELTWAAVAHGTHAGSLPLPDTIEAVLAARLDRLPPEAKRLVQIAAVMGPEVPVPLLHRLAGLPEDALQRGLAHLQAAEFLYETQLFPEPVYAFKHALTREVAYASLLHERRRILHAQIVEALEMLAGDRLDEQVERLAQHAFRGEVWDKAVAYYQQAGAKAHARAAWHEAVTCCEQALTALTHLPEISDRTVLAIDLRRSLGRALELLGEYDRARTHLKEAESLARALDDRARLGRVLVDIVQSRRMQADYANAMAVGQRALAIAAELGDRALQVAATQRLASVHFAIGDFGQAAVLLRRNVEVLESGAPDPGLIYGSQSRAWLALVLSTCGVFTEGRRYGDEALRLATTVKAMPTVANGCLGLLYLTKGDVEHAIQVLDPGRAFCRTTGNRDWGRWITAGLGHAYALAGRITEGLTLLEETLRDDLHACALNAHSEHVARLSEACRLAGYHDNAWQHARQALALARQYQERGYEAFALYQLGAVHASADPPEVEPAATHYRQALTLTEELGMRPLQAHCHLGLGTLYAQTGRRAQARAALGTAIALYRAMDMTFWLPQAEGALAQVDRR
jgi:tetratricopeptide (TPR) repeat protein